MKIEKYTRRWPKCAHQSFSKALEGLENDMLVNDMQTPHPHPTPQRWPEKIAYVSDDFKQTINSTKKNVVI